MTHRTRMAEFEAILAIKALLGKYIFSESQSPGRPEANNIVFAERRAVSEKR